MSQLHFAGLTQDGRSLLVLDERGEQHQLTLDERVKAAARGDAARLGQLELSIEPTLRPAEIQARIRAGESADEVAREASMPVDKVLRFAGTVMAERAMYADRARLARLRGGDRFDGQPLGEAVRTRLAIIGCDPETAVWDSARRPDGQWTISVRWGSAKRVGSASFTFDLLAQHVSPADDAARTLLVPAASTVPAARASRSAHQDAQDVPATPEDAIVEATEETGDEQPAEEKTADRPAVRPFSLIRSAIEVPPPAGAAVEPAAAPTADDGQPVEAEPQQERALASGEDARPSRGRHPKIPAWDDIVFGARKNG